MASDDRYTDDVHWMGGVCRRSTSLDHCHYMTPMNALRRCPRWGDPTGRRRCGNELLR